MNPPETITEADVIAWLEREAMRLRIERDYPAACVTLSVGLVSGVSFYVHTSPDRCGSGKTLAAAEADAPGSTQQVAA
jgi:hypothetical protein